MQDEKTRQHDGSNNYFSNTLTFFRNLFVDDKKEITLALLYEKNDKAKQLILHYAQHHTKEENRIFFNSLNHFNHTLLDQSIASKCYNCSALLLELGANPNKCIKNGIWEKYDHIERSLIGGGSSTYRLLSLYGVSIEGIKPCFETKAGNKRMQKYIDEVKDIYIPRGQRRMELMQEAEKAEKEHRYQEAANAYQEIADIWHLCYQEEKNNLLKDFYHERNLTFRRKAVELSQTYLANDKENSPLVTIYQRKKIDEQTKLTSSASPTFNKFQ